MRNRFTSLLLLLFVSISLQAQKKPSACDLKSGMRMLWEDHITWTRHVILNIIDDLPGTDQAVARLHQNQDDIGNSIKPYYGNAAGDQLASLLHDHINIAATLLTALKNNDTPGFNAANTQWIANADAIAAFLNAANPNHWPLSGMQDMMHDHLNHTAAEAAARKNMDYVADVAAFDEVHEQILEMADMLTEGIVAQFPGKFSGCPLTVGGKMTSCDLGSAMDKLWEDHIIWTRNVIFNILDDLPGTTQAVARLHQNQDDIGNAIKPFYGNAAGDQLASLLHDHINIAATLLTALKNNDTPGFNAANTQWVANADAIAAFLNGANPSNWPLSEMQDMMHDHLNHTAAEAAARKNMNYVADVAAFEEVHEQILAMAGMLTEGIVAQFPQKFTGCRDNHKPQNGSSARSVLEQNSPNPYYSTTTIRYDLPQHVTNARILILDPAGRQVKAYEIKTPGKGMIDLSANDLSHGLYSYVLFVNGAVAETRKLIKLE